MTRSAYTTKIADEIVAWLSEGKPLTEFCRQKGMPTRQTVGEWRKAHADFDIRFLQARDDGYDAIAHRLRNTARGYGMEKGGDSAGDVQRDKLIVDTDLKLLAKWDPRRYGDRLQLANDPDMPFVQQMDASAIDARIAELMAKGDAK